MARDFVSISKNAFSSLNWLFINVFAMPKLVIARLMIKDETATTTCYHGTIQQCYEKRQ